MPRTTPCRVRPLRRPVYFQGVSGYFQGVFPMPFLGVPFGPFQKQAPKYRSEALGPVAPKRVAP